jgi:DNA-binding Lrp family transcriptional regulator
MVEAVVLAHTEFESPQEQIFKKLQKINGVNEAYITASGVYNFVAKVQSKTIIELKNIFIKIILKIDSVMSTTTLVVAQKSIKDEKK